MRPDDASDYMDLEKWTTMEQLLDKYQIKYIFGIKRKKDNETQVARYKQYSEY